MLPVFLDCLYPVSCVPNVASVSGSILLHKIKNGSTVGKTLILTIENKGVGSSSNSLFLRTLNKSALTEPSINLS
jgi:hypothetical protein